MTLVGFANEFWNPSLTLAIYCGALSIRHLFWVLQNMDSTYTAKDRHVTLPSCWSISLLRTILNIISGDDSFCYVGNNLQGMLSTLGMSWL
jgi:hypothetical protein